MIPHYVRAIVRVRALPAALSLACALLLAGACGVEAAACGRSRPETPAPATERLVATTPPPERGGDASATSPAAHELPDVHTDWCLEGWRGLDEGTCYLVPDGWDRNGRRRLLVYLSGIVPPVPRSPQKENVQRIVAAAAKRAGAVVLLPRGRRGIGPKDAKDWWAWPTSAAAYATHAAAMVAEWTAARSTLEAALGAFDRTYLAGSSSGAYFLTALALGGAVEMDGYAAASGGAIGGGARASSAKKRPFYVGYATGDPTNGGPKALGAFLAAAGWPVRVAEHAGGHGAREGYIDEAFAFWEREARDGGAVER